MGKRKGLYSQIVKKCDGGESPNAFLPYINAEIRVHFPPYTVSERQVRAAIEQAVVQVMEQLEEHFETVE